MKTALAIALASLGMHGQRADLNAHSRTHWPHTCLLVSPRVQNPSGPWMRGRWNRQHDELTWDHGQVTFDGLNFGNGSNHAVRVTAQCARKVQS